jgi:voltage-gated sodium channel
MSQLFDKIKNKENNWFENAIMLLIFISACLIGLETIPGLSSEMSHILHTVDNIIISIFVAEVFIKMYANKPTPFDYFKDAWNLFDFIIVALSILPWLFEASSVVEAVIVFRLVRLTRVLRVLRFFSFVKPLQRLVNTLFQSLPSMSYVALIILILFYVYGIMGVFMFKVSDPEHYGDLSSAVLTLFQTITGEGWPDLLATQIENGNTLIASIFYISFIVIGSMIILNLFIGVIVSELENIRELDASGRKQTYDTDHVVILGWSDNIV